MNRFAKWLVASSVLAGTAMALTPTLPPTATPTPTVCFTLEPSTAAPGERVIADGDCPGLLHHRFIRIFFDSTLVAEMDFGGGRLFTMGFTVPQTAPPGLHTVTVSGPFLTSSAELEVTGSPISCIGDCDLDGQVQVDELLIGAAIALGHRPLEDCPSFDADGDARVAIDELISAVGSALNGCE